MASFCLATVFISKLKIVQSLELAVHRKQFVVHGSRRRPYIRLSAKGLIVGSARYTPRSKLRALVESTPDDG